MDLFSKIAVVITLAALCNYLNARFLKLPTTIGVMIMSLLLALTVLGVGAVWPEFGDTFSGAARQFMEQVDFSDVLLKGMLGFMLFAGAMHVEFNDLNERKWEIGIFSLLSTLASAFLVGFGVWGLAGVMGFDLQLIHCLLFGALISPTDPISVLAIMKKAGAPKPLETTVAGESLFNDGVGVVIFLSLLGIATGEHQLSAGYVAELFLREAVGAVLYGAALGYVGYRLLKSVDDLHAELMITVALVAGGYALADAIGVSAPIAMVVTGLMVGNEGLRLGIKAASRRNLEIFWELVDGLLNALLFVMIGLEVLVLTLEGRYLLAGAAAVPIVLLARLLSVGGPLLVLRAHRTYAHRTLGILTWGGLRGGISVAMALALPDGTPHRMMFLTMTYFVVAFAVIVQGLTIKGVVRRSLAGVSR